jgi:hypothetical protein
MIVRQLPADGGGQPLDDQAVGAYLKSIGPKRVANKKRGFGGAIPRKNLRTTLRIREDYCMI